MQSNQRKMHYRMGPFSLEATQLQQGMDGGKKRPYTGDWHIAWS